MGAKQSKRSVDISGKEAESAGEVAAAGAGGEGRVEPLADVDLKPQLNGDAHIQANEQTDKEKDLDSGTPENEKDATTEKGEKDQENGKEKESTPTPVTNGESEPKGENGDSSPAIEDGKKPKKEKVKKKWSLRSISFSRKDKPKQEKKQKEEEVKTNGEHEKVPEEAAEATPETVESKVVEEVKSDIADKEEKTPETPVTEPITNGSSTPESTKNETPTIEIESTPASPDSNSPEVKVETEPEQLPLNGLSLEEKEEPKIVQNHETKPEETVVESTETVSAPEIPVKTEEPSDVKAEQEPETENTEAPETCVEVSIPKTESKPKESEITEASEVDNSEINKSLEEMDVDKKDLLTVLEQQKDVDKKDSLADLDSAGIITLDTKIDEVASIDGVDAKVNEMDSEKNILEDDKLNKIEVIEEKTVMKLDTNEINDLKEDLPPPPVEIDIVGNIVGEAVDVVVTENIIYNNIDETKDVLDKINNENILNSENNVNDIDTKHVEREILDGNETDIQQQNFKNKETGIADINVTECNGKLEFDIPTQVQDNTIEIKPVISFEEAISEKVIISSDHLLQSEVESAPQDDTSSNGASETSLSASKEPIDNHQETILVSDKLADLIPEVPVVPELKTELETSQDVAVTN